MIIDAHAHLVAPESLYGFRSMLQVSNGLHHIVKPSVSDEELARSAARNVAVMDSVGTDMQLLSPRPFMLWHSHPRVQDVQKWVQANNDLIARTVALHPTRFRGVAGLPQVSGQPITIVFDEMDRCLDELGFVGVLVNPDPGEGDGKTPTLGDPYWYPLYEKLVERDIPAHIHGAACYGRENYSEHFATEESLAITSIARSRVFQDFPTLKLMISHGGGAIPYQIGRWRAERLGLRNLAASQPDTLVSEISNEPFDTTLRRFWFDTVLYNKESLELLFKIVGADRCLFGTERPGSGSALDPATGRSLDDLRPVIEEINILSDADKHAIFEGNARAFYSRLKNVLEPVQR
ncbi:MAG TPA: amidohydrolase family protein [Ktedonobacteraceae bacterium]|nr:amidohydrolase family protein [Ktedonobacteraceae bacterium]